jgi:hypothetical protein
MISPFQHQQNIERLNALKERGFIFNITADGYSVKFGAVFLGGASVMLPRKKPLHWQHRAANMKENVAQALLVADEAV